MAKGIIIIDVPESCDECPVVFRHEEERCCCITKRNSFTTKPDWCPIKPLPEKYSINGTMHEIDIDVAIGRNAVIDEILGE